MLAALAFLATTVTLTPTDDVWVYPHASDQAGDIYLRVWGAEGREVPTKVAEIQDFGFSYLKWDVSKVPSGTLTAAKLILTHIPNPGFAADYAKDNPLHVRPVGSNWNEKTWEYDMAEQIMPDADAKNIFGGGFPTKWEPGKEFTITIDLMKGPGNFKAYLDQAEHSKDHALAVALTAGLDVEAFGQGSIYKVYSTNADAPKRPRLELTIE